MEFLNKYNLTPMKILKIIGLSFLGLIVLIIVLNFVGTSLFGISRNFAPQSALNLSKYADDTVDYEAMESPASYGAGSTAKLSARNAVPEPGMSSGNTAEDYEVASYNSTIETGNLKQTCAAISGLKPREYVIFESSNEYDTGCSYNFKVDKQNKDEILAIIENLDPKTLSENVYTIKQQIDDFTGEEQILKNKLKVIEDTLSGAIISYDEISRLATQQRDVESLAKIIDSKIRIIESLSQQRVNVSSQLERLSRSKAEQLDRLEYVYFYVRIYESKFFDPEAIKDSWKAAVKNFVRDMNKVLQSISINLVYAIFVILQYVLYILIIILAAKYIWKYIKYIWRK